MCIWKDGQFQIVYDIIAINEIIYKFRNW